MDEFWIPTVAVNVDGARVLINQKDFDPASHIAWSEGKQEQNDDGQADAEEPAPVAAPRRGRPPTKR